MSLSLFSSPHPRSGYLRTPLPLPESLYRCAGGRAYAPNFLGLMGLPKILTHGAPLARFAHRSSVINLQKKKFLVYFISTFRMYFVSTDKFSVLFFLWQLISFVTMCKRSTVLKAAQHIIFFIRMLLVIWKE